MKRLKYIFLSLFMAACLSAPAYADGQTCIINNGGYMVAVDCSCLFNYYYWQLYCDIYNGCPWIPNPC